MLIYLIIIFVSVLNSTFAANTCSVKDLCPLYEVGCGACDARWTLYNDHCYFKVQEQLTWTDAGKECKKHGADLVTLESIDEYKWFIEYAKENVKYWLGSRNAKKSLQRGDYKWVSKNSFVNRQLWIRDYPKKGQFCLLICGSTRKYCTDTCEAKHQAICEKRKNTHSCPLLTKRLENLEQGFESILKEIRAERDAAKEAEKAMTTMVAPETTIAPREACPKDWQDFGWKCYFKNNNYTTRDDGIKRCKEFHKDATLVTIFTQEENDFLKNKVVRDEGDFWLSAKRYGVYDQYVWHNDEMMNFTDWPDVGVSYGTDYDDVCVIIQENYWNTALCINKVYLLCELKLAH